MNNETDIDYETPAEMPDHLDDVEARQRLDWHLRMIRRISDESAKTIAVFNAEIERLKDERDDIVAGSDARLAWHRGPVEAYHLALVRDDPENAPRTLRLPSGVSKVRVPKERRMVWTEDGNEAAADWLVENGHEQLVTHRTTLGKIREVGIMTPNGSVVDRETGEIIPGVTSVLDEPTVSTTTIDEVAP